MLLWLKENYGAEVVCFCADVGQGEKLSVFSVNSLFSVAKIKSLLHE
jgi:argininosuccinate synthase